MTFQLEIEGKFCGVAYSQFFCWKKLSSSTKKSSDGQNCLLSSAMSCRRRFPINVLDSMESTTSFLLMQNALGGSVLSQELHRRHLAWALPFLLSELNNRESGPGHSKISWFGAQELSNLSGSALHLQSELGPFLAHTSVYSTCVFESALIFCL